MKTSTLVNVYKSLDFKLQLLPIFLVSGSVLICFRFSITAGLVFIKITFVLYPSPRNPNIKSVRPPTFTSPELCSHKKSPYLYCTQYSFTDKLSTLLQFTIFLQYFSGNSSRRNSRLWRGKSIRATVWAIISEAKQQ